MITITEFLLARIAEDEVRSGSGWSRNPEERWESDNYGTSMLTPRAVLAECAAKRAIIRDAEEWIALGDRAETTGMQALARFTRDTTVLRHLAAVYADHPDYREEWTL